MRLEPQLIVMIIICTSTNGNLLVNIVIYKHKFVVISSRGMSAFEQIFKCLESVIDTINSALISPVLKVFCARKHQFHR